MQFGRYVLLFLLVTRAGVDPLIVESRVAGGGFSPGAILNVAAISLFIFSLAAKRQASIKVPLLVWGPYLLLAAFSLSYTPDVFDATRVLLSMLSYPAVFGSTFLLLQSENQVASL